MTVEEKYGTKEFKEFWERKYKQDASPNAGAPVWLAIDKPSMAVSKPCPECEKHKRANELFSRKQLAERIDNTARTVHYYTEQGLLIPAVNTTGKGTTRMYSRYNLFEMLLIKELVLVGLALDTIKGITRYLRQERVFVDSDGKELLIIYDARPGTGQGSIFLSNTDGEGKVSIDMKGRSTVIILDLYSIRKKAA